MEIKFNSKAEARAYFSALRASIDENAKKEKSLDICKRILSLPEFEECDVLFLYSPIKSEADPTYLLEVAEEKGINVAFPISIKDNNTLDFRIVDALSDLNIGAYGIREPKCDSKKAIFTQKSICIVPALSFDSNGNRLGYGKGFYDRFLSEFTGLSVGITFCELKCDLLPTENTDIPVDIIITDKESVRIK